MLACCLSPFWITVQGELTLAKTGHLRLHWWGSYFVIAKYPVVFAFTDFQEGVDTLSFNFIGGSEVAG